jgi:hypothetical protein
MKSHAEILADAQAIAAFIARTGPSQRDELYEAVANELRVTQNIFTSTLFETLAREERQEERSPSTQRLMRAMRK